MQVNCPNCTRPVETSSAALRGPAQTIRCNWCGDHFAMHGGTPMSTGEFRKINEEPPPSEEVWEVDADAAPVAPASTSIFDDMEMDDPTPPQPGDPNGLMLYPTEDLSGNTQELDNWEDTPDALPASQEPNIPDLPSAPAQVSALVERLGQQTWSQSGSNIDENVPELPDFDDMEFQDATPNQDAFGVDDSIAEQAPVVPAQIMSSPPPLIEESIDDLLGDFISDEGRGEELLLRFYVRRNSKDYGPFTEEEVHSLLESRKLMGDELCRPQHETDWVPLRERPDFKATIAILEKQSVRVGWDGQAPSTPKKDLPTMDLPEEPDEFDMSDLDIQEIPPGPAPSEGVAVFKDIRFLAGLALGLLLIVSGVVWSVTRNSKSGVKKNGTKNILAGTISNSDDFPSYRILLKKLTTSFRKHKFHLSWYKVRFLYYMLDSHGEDSAVRADIKPITERLLKRKVGLMMRSRLVLARAVSLRKRDAIQAAFKALTKPLPPTHEEWGHLLARTQELLGKHEQARDLYKGLLKRHPNHVRAYIGLFRTHLALGQERKAARYLYRGLKRAPSHLPIQLLGVSFAKRTGRWQTRIGRMLGRIKRQVKARHYTQSSLAHWNAIVARRHWEQRKMDKAIHRIERATTLAPARYDFFLTKVQYYRWSRQYFLALRSIEQRKAWRVSHPALLFIEFDILRESRQGHKIEGRLNALQALAVTPAQKSVLYTLLGNFYLAQQREKDAVESYNKARKVIKGESSPPYGTWALIKLYMKESKWKRAKKLLKALRQTEPIRHQTRILWGEYLFQRKRYKEALAESKVIKKEHHIHYSGYLLASRIYRRTVGLQRAANELRRALYLHPQRPSKLLLTLSDLYIEQDKPRKALRSLQQFEKLLQGAPPCPFLQRKAEVLLQLKRCKELVAIKAKRCKKRFNIHLARGQCAEQLDQNDVALRAYKLAQMVGPQALEPLSALARFHKKQGNFSESTRLLGILNRKRPSDKSNLLTMVKLFEQKGLYERALQLVLQRRHIFRGDFDVALTRARLEGSMSRTTRALRQLRKLKRKAKGKEQKAELYHAFGRTMGRAKKDKQASKYYKQAIELRPQKAILYLELGYINYRTKQYEACKVMAKTFLAKAKRRDPGKSRARALQKACKMAVKAP